MKRKIVDHFKILSGEIERFLDFARDCRWVCPGPLDGDGMDGDAAGWICDVMWCDGWILFLGGLWSEGVEWSM